MPVPFLYQHCVIPKARAVTSGPRDLAWSTTVFLFWEDHPAFLQLTR
jgi:hypothetical protein